MENVYAGRIARLRSLMSRDGIDAIIVPQADPHQSEYLAAHWQARRFLSGFTGSAGTLLVTADKAALWTDSRYFLQAADQLAGTGVELMKEGVPGTPSQVDWLAANLKQGSTVGVNGMLLSVAAEADLREKLARHKLMLDVDYTPIDEMWTDRPALPQCEIMIHDEKYAGRPAADKVAVVLAAAKAQGATSVLLSPLDEIAWMLNIRSRDVNYNPVVTSFLYLAPQGSTIFVDEAKVTPAVADYLATIGIATAPYNSIGEFLNALPADERVHIDTAHSAGAIARLLGARMVSGESLVAGAKGCKNDVQIQGIRNAMVRDGQALVGAMMEVEALAAAGTLTELQVAEIFRRHREAQPLFFDESFGLIAGWNGHGAIVHYEADEASNATVSGDGLLLIDSGAQYLDGTTDITRTIAVGTPTAQQRTDFTLVMKGHFALARAIWPEGTHGLQLDALARQFLWQRGLSYLHGTGHGVGHFLNVHEGPQKISLIYQPAPLVPGMITSNEPGLYRAGEYGIRCECLTLVVPAMTTEFGNFYKFETLTLFPFDLRLFDVAIMTDDEIDWLNDYHRRVRQLLTPGLPADQAEWLAAKTAMLTR